MANIRTAIVVLVTLLATSLSALAQETFTADEEKRGFAILRSAMPEPLSGWKVEKTNLERHFTVAELERADSQQRAHSIAVRVLYSLVAKTDMQFGDIEIEIIYGKAFRTSSFADDDEDVVTLGDKKVLREFIVSPKFSYLTYRYLPNKHVFIRMHLNSKFERTEPLVKELFQKIKFAALDELR